MSEVGTRSADQGGKLSRINDKHRQVAQLSKLVRVRENNFHQLDIKFHGLVINSHNFNYLYRF